jgi:hypothetical protein
MNKNIETKVVCACGNSLLKKSSSEFFAHQGSIPAYAVLPDGTKVCYSCADKRQVEDLKDRSRPFTGYVGPGAKTITTWTGGVLMQVTRAWPCRLTRESFTHDRSGYLSIHAVDVHGGHWAGRGSEGIVIKMRPVNVPRHRHEWEPVLSLGAAGQVARCKVCGKRETFLSES